MATGMSNDENENGLADETKSRAVDLAVGDQIELVYEDSPETVMRATVSRILSDSDEGMGTVVEDYVACWYEIEMTGVEGEGNAEFASQPDAWKRTVTLCTDYRYSLDGRRVALRKF